MTRETMTYQGVLDRVIQHLCVESLEHRAGHSLARVSPGDVNDIMQAAVSETIYELRYCDMERILTDMQLGGWRLPPDIGSENWAPTLLRDILMVELLPVMREITEGALGQYLDGDVIMVVAVGRSGVRLHDVQTIYFHDKHHPKQPP